MEINIIKFLMNIGEKSNFDWNNFWLTAFGAFFGALCAYIFNKYQERQNNKNKLISKTDTLLHYLNSLYQDLEKLYTTLETELAFNNEIKFVTPSFKITQANDYTYLSYYNLYFTSLLEAILWSYSALLEMVNVYNKSIKEFLYVSNNDEGFNKKKAETLNSIKNTIKNILIFSIILEKYLVEYKIKGLYSYYVSNNIEQVEKYRKLETIYPKYKEDDLYKRWNQALNSQVINYPNIYCHFCNLKNKIKNFFILLVMYFKNPNKCKDKNTCGDKNAE